MSGKVHDYILLTRTEALQGEVLNSMFMIDVTTGKVIAGMSEDARKAAILNNIDSFGAFWRHDHRGNFRWPSHVGIDR